MGSEFSSCNCWFKHCFLVDPAEILSGPISNPSSPLINGSNLTLSCSISGAPLPNITWLVNGSEIDVDSNNRLTASVDEDSAQLQFEPVTDHDAGSYQCSAYNSIGNSSLSHSSINIVVHCESQLVHTLIDYAFDWHCLSIIAAPPDPVKSFNVSNILPTSVFLTWILGFNGNSNITEILVLYVTEANFRIMTSQNQTIDLQESPIQELGISMLEPNTQYSFSLIVINDIGYSKTVTVLKWTLAISKSQTTAEV